MTHPLFEAHRATLDGALDALAKRGYWSPYPETMSGKIYGETANAEAKARFEAQMNKPFELDQHGCRPGRRRALALRLRPRHHLSQAGYRQDAGRGEGGDACLAQGGDRSAGGRVPGDPAPA